MAELMLALGRNDLASFVQIDEALLPEVHALKLLNDEMYTRNQGFVVQAGISYFARTKGIKNIFADTKFAFDDAEEMIDGVDKIMNSYTEVPVKQTKYSKRPDFISSVVDSTEVALSAFEQQVIAIGSTPVCHVTSSRFTNQDYRNRNTTREKNVKWKLDLFNNSSHNMGVAVVAAADVELVRKLEPKLKLIVFGAYLDEANGLRHPGGAPIEKVVEFADFISVGSAVFEAENPSRELERRLAITKR